MDYLLCYHLALLPRSDLLVTFTGVCEVLGVVGLLIPRVAPVGTLSLTFPANTNLFVFGNSGRVVFEDLYQPASLQQSNSTHARLGQTRPLRQFSQTPRDTLLLRAIKCSPEVDVNQKNSRGL